MKNTLVSSGKVTKYKYHKICFFNIYSKLISYRPLVFKIKGTVL